MLIWSPLTSSPPPSVSIAARVLMAILEVTIKLNGLCSLHTQAVSSATASAKTCVCKSTSASVVAGHISAML